MKKPTFCENALQKPLGKNPRQELGRKELREWIGTIGALFTTCGIIATISVSIFQLRQTVKANEEARFQEVLKRLGSPSVQERLTGIAGLAQYASDPSFGHQIDSFDYLIDITIVEDSPLVRSAALDLMRDLSANIRDASLIDHSLNRALTRNRAMWGRLLAVSFPSNSDDQIRAHIDQLSAKMTQYPPTELDALKTSAAIITVFLRAGGHAKDFSAIYCEGCIFSEIDHPTDLSNAKFDNSFLRNTRFRKANLKAASFKNADLYIADFLSADLTNADLTVQIPDDWNDISGTEIFSMPGTNFSCASLNGSKFAGRNIAYVETNANNSSFDAGVFLKKNGANAYSGTDEFFQANLDDADMTEADLTPANWTM